MRGRECVSVCGCGRALSLDCGDRRDKRSGQRFRGAGLWHLVRVLAQVFAVFRCWFYGQKVNKRLQAERAKTARNTATKKRKNPDKIKTFSHFSIDKYIIM